jgi:hypothetical protein
MSQLISYIYGDESIYLHSPPSRVIVNMSGWGNPNSNVRSISTPYQHGETVVSYRLTPRTITLDLIYKGKSRSDWYDERSKLIDRMGLNNTFPNLPSLGTLRWEFLQNDVYVTRDLDCYLNRGLRYDNSLHWHEHGIRENLEFIALDPTIYDPLQVTETIDSFTEELILPMEFPFVLGTDVGTATITYTGTWTSYPIIEIDGPTEDFYLENTATGSILRLDYFISTGETVTFDLTPGSRSVTNQLGTNLIQYILDSDLNTFAIEHDPIVAGGVNTFLMYLINTGATTEVRINYFNRYYGI